MLGDGRAWWRRLVNDDAFVDHVSDRLEALPGVAAVSLGGSRAQGTHRPDSDWDFAIYYRGHFDPQALRDIGWPGEVSEVGGWSDGVFNGGAWLEIDGRRVDVHYRDLDVIDREIADSREGWFRIEPLMFHLAGIPSYLVVAELAVSRVLRTCMPNCAQGKSPSYPALVVLWRPEPLPDHPGLLYFTRITRIYPGKRRPPLYNCHGNGTRPCYPLTSTFDLWSQMGG